jgi:undecaprenyl diphosphate synthase
LQCKAIVIEENFMTQREKQEGLHVGIIMDGNGRWATRRGLSRVAGHRAGVAAVRRIVEHAPGVGIRCLTVYAFSSDNWRRPPREVHAILSLIAAYLRIEAQQLKRSGARLEVVGRRDRLPRFLLREIARCESITAHGSRLRLRVALDYSSRDAMVRAAAGAAAALPPNEPASLDLLSRMMHEALTAESGEVDLLIRTGGEQRLSDFLLWECAYAELYFSSRMWPEFDTADLDAAIADFHRRERRFGAVPEPVGPARAPVRAVTAGVAR